MLNKIKKWLQKSGIKYNTATCIPNSPDDDLLLGTEIEDSLNPFDDIIEDPAYPMARIYREDFWTALSDTYNVLVGKHFDIHLTGWGRKGILDVLIFPIIGRHLIGYSANQNSNFILAPIAKTIGYMLEIPRHILGVGLTLALSPIVAITHLFTRPKANKLKKEVENLPIIELTHEMKEVTLSNKVTKEILAEKKIIFQKQTETSLKQWMQKNREKCNKQAKTSEIKAERIGNDNIFHYDWNRRDFYYYYYFNFLHMNELDCNKSFIKDYKDVMEHLKQTALLLPYLEKKPKYLTKPLSFRMNYFCELSLFKTKNDLSHPKTKAEKAFRELNISKVRANH